MGDQGAQGDVKAFTMKKWFNTNYHYMVPELDDDMELKLRSDAFLDGFHQARSLGIQTKPRGRRTVYLFEAGPLYRQ